MKKFWSWLKSKCLTENDRRAAEDMTLSEAAITIAGRIGPTDVFSVDEARWRNTKVNSTGEMYHRTEFRVSLWKGEEIVAQLSGPNLRNIVERALLTWESAR